MNLPIRPSVGGAAKRTPAELKRDKPEEVQVKAPEHAVEGTPEVPTEQAQLSTDAAQESKQSSQPTAAAKRSRRLRRGFLTAASTAMALVGGLTAIPAGMQLGLDTKAGRSEEVTTLNQARISTLTSVGTSSLVGMSVLGPVGLVVGGVVGYITGTIGNHISARSGVGPQSRAKVAEAVKESVGDSKGLWGTTKALFRGAVEGAKTGYSTRKTTSKIQLAGMMDGVTEAVKDVRDSEGESHPELSSDSGYGAIRRTLMAAGGLLGGIAGVMINAPGGAVIGALHSLKETKSSVPSEMEKSLMLWATNVGKFLPAAAVSTVVGGAAGIAVSTAVGVTTASLASIIDGRLGINHRISRPVEKAVKEAHGEEDVKENLRAYYRAGKGAVVGLVAGTMEGWKAGFQGGMEIVKGVADSVPESIDKSDPPGPKAENDNG